MRKVLCAAVLALCASGAEAAERITTTDGGVYVRAADGWFYPAQWVASNGQVLNPLHHQQVRPTVVPHQPAPFHFQLAPAGGGCANGQCPSVRRR